MTPDNKVTLSVLTEEEGLHKASSCSPCPLPSFPRLMERAHFDNLVFLYFPIRRSSCVSLYPFVGDSLRSDFLSLILIRFLDNNASSLWDNKE